MLQHILVPLDGSLRAERALPVAAQIARATSGSLLIVRVVNPPVDYSSGLSPVPLMNERVVESERKRAADYLAAVAAQPLLTEIPTTTRVLFGSTAQQLSEVARAHASDLIVLSSRGRTGLARWALGSVAYTLTHQSIVPVLVLRADEAAAPIEMGHPCCTLVPLDGSPFAEAALTPAMDVTRALSAPARGTLHLVQVVKPFQSATSEGFIDELNEDTCQQAHAYLATVAARVESEGTGRRLEVTASVKRASDVTGGLLSVAEQEGSGGCALVAISTHGRQGLQRWVMGSVTQRILNTSKLPVLVIRPQIQE